MNSETVSIVLASSSPRRRRIFEHLGVPCELAVPGVDERAIPYSAPRELALKAADAKAAEVAEGRPARTLVVGVDTIVVLDGRVYGKPDDEADARRMLGELAGRTHTVISGVAVVEVGGSTLLDAVETDVELHALTPAEVADYVATGEPLDKAGSYALQGIGGRLVREVRGDYFNVVGLPVARLMDMLAGYVDTSEWTGRMASLRREF